ncbi:hypothetical protein C8F04DRAFT_1392737, partial [Mycena alexandri]
CSSPAVSSTPWHLPLPWWQSPKLVAETAASLTTAPTTPADRPHSAALRVTRAIARKGDSEGAPVWNSKCHRKTGISTLRP